MEAEKLNSNILEECIIKPVVVCGDVVSQTTENSDIAVKRIMRKLLKETSELMDALENSN